MVSPHSHLKKVTQRVIERSKPTRAAYLARIDGLKNRTILPRCSIQGKHAAREESGKARAGLTSAVVSIILEI